MRASVGLEDEGQRVREALPCRALGVELFLARRGKLVEARAAVVLRRCPRRRNPAARLQPAEGGVERAVVDVEHAARDGLDRLRELPPVGGAGAKELQDNEVESALEQVDLLFGHGAPLEMQ